MDFDPHLPDLPDAGGPVGPENETEKLRHEVVEFPARHGIGNLRTIGAGAVRIPDTAGPQLAPFRLMVFAASRAFINKIPLARPAIQPAIGHQGRIRHDCFHFPSFQFQNVSRKDAEKKAD